MFFSWFKLLLHSCLLPQYLTFLRTFLIKQQKQQLSRRLEKWFSDKKTCYSCRGPGLHSKDSHWQLTEIHESIFRGPSGSSSMNVVYMHEPGHTHAHTLKINKFIKITFYTLCTMLFCLFFLTILEDMESQFLLKSQRINKND